MAVSSVKETSKRKWKKNKKRLLHTYYSCSSTSKTQKRSIWGLQEHFFLSKQYASSSFTSISHQKGTWLQLLCKICSQSSKLKTQSICFKEQGVLLQSFGSLHASCCCKIVFCLTRSQKNSLSIICQIHQYLDEGEALFWHL